MGKAAGGDSSANLLIRWEGHLLVTGTERSRRAEASRDSPTALSLSPRCPFLSGFWHLAR